MVSVPPISSVLRDADAFSLPALYRTVVMRDVMRCDLTVPSRFARDGRVDHPRLAPWEPICDEKRKVLGSGDVYPDPGYALRRDDQRRCRERHDRAARGSVSKVSSPTSPVTPVCCPKSNMSLLSMCGRLTRSIDSYMDVQTLSFMCRDNKDKVETYLAFGASRFEACRPIATEALKVALTPNVSQMSVIGLISIPGPYSVSYLPPALCLGLLL